VTERLRVAVPDGGHVAVVLHRPHEASRVPCVLACHGLSAAKDSDKYLLLGDELPRAGLALARFDFRGCGESSGVETDTAIATRLEDATSVLAALEHHAGLDGRFGLLGSSLGGFVALHLASARGGDVPVVTWNAPASLDELGDTTRDDRAGLGPAFYAELASRRYAVAPSVARHLIVQGDADTVVPVRHAEALARRARQPFECRIIAGGDHRLTEPAHRGEAVRASVAWLGRFLC
jgi:fermentation-respiration switch protein FrsA (DUF1100 family)